MASAPLCFPAFTHITLRDQRLNVVSRADMVTKDTFVSKLVSASFLIPAHIVLVVMKRCSEGTDGVACFSRNQEVAKEQRIPVILARDCKNRS